MGGSLSNPFEILTKKRFKISAKKRERKKKNTFAVCDGTGSEVESQLPVGGSGS